MKKKIIFILLPILLHACNTQDKRTLDFLDKGIINSNNEMELLNELCKVRIYEEFQIYPNKFEKYRKQADFFWGEHKKVLNLINEISEKESSILQKGDFKNLLTEIHKFKQIAIKFCPAKKEEFEKLFDKTSFEKIKSKQQLNILKTRIQQALNISLKTIFEKIKVQIPLFLNSQREVIVIPKSKKVKQRNFFEAEIFPVVIDTSYVFEVVINRDTFRSKNGKVDYSIHTTLPGINTFEGKLYYINPAVNNKIYTFKSEFTVK